MRLRKIKIEGYKHLKDTTVEFREHDNSFGKAAIRFFIGLNGSGKSAFLEAIGLIFTRIMQDEVPGFNFELEYSINTDGNEVRVFVCSSRQKIKDETLNRKAKLEIVTLDSEGHKKIHNSYSSLKELKLHPHRIIAYSSGPNSIMQDVLLLSPRKSLYSDIYDAGDMVRSSKTSFTREKEIGKSIEHIDNLDNDPRCIFIDGVIKEEKIKKFLILVEFFNKCFSAIKLIKIEPDLIFSFIFLNQYHQIFTLDELVVTYANV